MFVHYGSHGIALLVVLRLLFWKKKKKTRATNWYNYVRYKVKGSHIHFTVFHKSKIRSDDSDFNRGTLLWLHLDTLDQLGLAKTKMDYNNLNLYFLVNFKSFF